jgi:tetratricopeptide (TPR) repeat protein
MAVAPPDTMSVPSPGGAPGASSGSRRSLLLAVLLATALVAIYLPVRGAGFFYLDDDFYVTANPFVRDGVTLAGLGHAFLSSHGGLWMPLAFTSHMIDVSLFGLDPTGPHVVNVVLHVVNAALLLAVLLRTTGALAPSLAAAALFACHPMRVESVAWIAERKDVLSALFGLLALHWWVDFTRAPSARAYRLVVAATIAALLSKPMLVTLPLLLVCFDVWPLGRLGTARPDGRALRLKDLVVEKLPLLALAGAAAAITLAAAGTQGALAALESRSLGTRLAHALGAYAWYAWKTLWPTDLGVFYPYPTWSGWQIAGAALFVAGSAAVSVATWRRAPWVAVGLAWFAIGLAPVIGIFQAGGQGMADRFTYVPAIGLVIALVWSLHEIVRARTALAGAALVAVATLAAGAHRQATYWRTSEALLEHTLAVTANNWRMESALGSVLANAGRNEDASAHFTRALAIEPRDPVAQYGMGLSLDGLGRPDEAIVHYREAIHVDPGYWRAHNNVGVYLLHHGDVDGALHHLSEAVRLNPDAADATRNLRGALAVAGFPDTNTDGYLQGLRAWSAAIASDGSEPGAAAYNASLAVELLRAHAALVHGCIGADAHPAFSLYVQVDATGQLTAVTAMPPTPVARCVRDELRTAHAPAPPFAPFHARIPIEPPRDTSRGGGETRDWNAGGTHRRGAAAG